MVREDGQTGLVIGATEKHWGPGFIQAGLASSNDFEGDSTVRFGLLYTSTAINALNGEFRIGGQLGERADSSPSSTSRSTPCSRYFVAGRVGNFTTNVNVFDAAGDNLARYQLGLYGVDLGAGREFGTWGEGRIGLRRYTGEAQVRIGEPSPDIDVDRGELFLRLSADKLDDLYFPTSGYLGWTEYIVARDSLGARLDYDQLLMAYTHAYTWGRNTLIGSLAGATTFDDNAPIESLFRLGGLFRLSGLQDGQLSGQHFGLGNLVYMRQLQQSGVVRSWAGASLEVGNVWQNSSDASSTTRSSPAACFSVWTRQSVPFISPTATRTPTTRACTFTSARASPSEFRTPAGADACHQTASVTRRSLPSCTRSPSPWSERRAAMRKRPQSLPWSRRVAGRSCQSEFETTVLRTIADLLSQADARSQHRRRG